MPSLPLWISRSIPSRAGVTAIPPESLTAGYVCSAALLCRPFRTGKRKSSAPTGAGSPGGRHTRRNGIRKPYTTTCVPGAVLPSPRRGGTRGFALPPATPPPGKESAVKIELAKKVAAYRTAMSVAREMVSKGILTDEEYAVIDTKMAGKYGLNSSTIFRRIDLINSGTDVNIRH